MAAIEHDELLPHPPARVWQALTDPTLHERWWAAGDIRPEVGHRFQLDMGPWGKQDCEVLAVEHERLFSFRFALDTTITWRLVPEGHATRLLLTHDGFDLDDPMAKQMYEGMGGGWADVVARMAPALAGAS